MRLVALSCSLHLTFDDSFIARRALFVKYLFTEIENNLVYINIDDARVICYCVFIDAARYSQGISLAIFWQREGAKPGFCLLSHLTLINALPRVRQYR